MKIEYRVETKNKKFNNEWNPVGYEQIFDELKFAKNYIEFRKRNFAYKDTEYRIVSREVSDWKEVSK